jgi:biopolymer transport protein ExbB
MDLQALIDQALGLWGEARDIWLSGGWAMTAIAVIALVMFSVGMGLHFKLRAKGFQRVPESTWRHWLERRLEREGVIGDLLDEVADGDSIEGMTLGFDELRTTEIVPLDRDLRVMKTCVSAAPLVGLLGTVTGMLSTFGALATGGGGDKTMGMVAKGISEALITTETGLVIALPGLFFQYQLARKTEAYRAFLAHLESVCVQRLFRKQREAAAREQTQRARAEARRLLRTRLAQRIHSA